MEKKSIISHLKELYQPKQISVITDAEPDDLLMLLLMNHSQEFWDLPINIVAAGWQDVCAKASFLDRFLKRNAPRLNVHAIYQGLASDIPFSYHDALLEAPSAYPPPPVTIWQYAMIILVAPPRDLLALGSAGRDLLSSSCMLAYGSFNFRSILEEDSTVESHQALLQLLAAPQSTIIYENHYAVSSGGRVEDPELCTALATTFPDFSEAIRLWNEHMRAVCHYRLLSLSSAPSDPKSKAVRSRSSAILASIERSPLQFVNADSGLILAAIAERSLLAQYASVDPVNLSFHPISFYSQIDATNPHSSISFIRGLSPSSDSFQNYLFDALRKICKK